MAKQILGFGNFLLGVFVMLFFGLICYGVSYWLYDEYMYEKILYSEGVIAEGLVIKKNKNVTYDDVEYFITYTFDVAKTTIKNTVEVEDSKYYLLKEGKQAKVIYIPDNPEWNSLHGIRWSPAGTTMFGMFVCGFFGVLCIIAIVVMIIKLLKGGYSNKTFFVATKEK